MELQQKLLEAAIVVFNQKGMKFTMDDLARQLEISKKTIYTVFLNKEELLYGMLYLRLRALPTTVKCF